MHDTTEITEEDTMLLFSAKMDSVAVFLEREIQHNPCVKTPEDKKRERDNRHKLISSYISKRDFGKAQQELQLHSPNCNYCRFSQQLLTLEQSQEKNFKLKTDNALKAEVEQIANAGNNKQEETNARVLLAFVFDEFLPFNVEPLIFNSQNKMASPQSENSENQPLVYMLQENEYLNVYPNPAKENFTIAYNLQNEKNIPQLIITDIGGRIIMQNALPVQQGVVNVDVKGMSNGMYFYSIVVNNTTIAKNKIIISRD